MTAAALTLPPDPRVRFDRRLILILSYIAFVVLGTFDGLLGVAFALMRTDFPIGLGALSTILIPSTVGFLLSSFVVGRVLSRFSMGTVMLAAATLRALCFVIFAVAPQWWMISATALLLGFSGGFIDAGLNTWFAIRYSPRYMNWLHACFGVGATVAPLILTWLLTLGFSWRAGFVALTVMQAAVALLVLITLPRWNIAPLPESSPEKGSGNGPADVPRAQTLRLPAVWLGILVFFIYTGLELTAGNWSFTIFTDAHSVDVVTAARWASYYWGIFMLSRVLFGFIQVKSVTGLIRVVLIAAMAGALLLATARTPFASLAGTLVLGFAVAPVFALLVYETPLRLGRAHAQHAIGLQIGAASLGGAVLSSGAGGIAQVLSPAAVPWYLVIVAALLFVLHELLSRTHAPATRSLPS